MFSALGLLLCLTGVAGTPVQADPARVKSATAELEQAWKSTSAGERVRAIQASGNVPDGAVVKLVARGLRDKDLDVQRAAIEALRWVGHPDALKELQALAREDRSSRKEPSLYAQLLRAVGQYGSASSIHLLGDEAWSVKDPHVIQACILGLGRIRTREALERLLELMRLAGPERIDALMPDFRLALAVLTGTDQGNSPLGWQNWWIEKRVQLKLAAQLPELPRDLERKWKVYWGELEADARPTKRSERGRDASPARN